MQIPQMFHIGDENGAVRCWTLGGSACTISDVLTRNIAINNLQIGDALVLKRTGAYSAMGSMVIFLSREMLRICLYSEKDVKKVVRNFIGQIFLICRIKK